MLAAFSLCYHGGVEVTASTLPTNKPPATVVALEDGPAPATVAPFTSLLTVVSGSTWLDEGQHTYIISRRLRPLC